MTSSSVLPLRGFEAAPSAADPIARAAPARDLASGAPCLGLALLAGGVLWAGLGSAVALLLL